MASGMAGGEMPGGTKGDANAGDGAANPILQQLQGAMQGASVTQSQWIDPRVRQLCKHFQIDARTEGKLMVPRSFHMGQSAVL